MATLAAILRTVLTALLVGSTCLWAELPMARAFFRTYGIPEGLETLATTHLVQDGEGYLWVGTQANLFRYEGGRFRSFGLHQGLPSTFITALIPAPDRGVYAGTWVGVVRVEGLEVRTFPELPPTRVLGLATDADGTVWAAFQRGLYHRHRHQERFESVRTWTLGPPAAIFSPSRGVLLAASGSVLHRLAPDRGPEELARLPEPIRDIACLQDGSILLLTQTRLWSLTPGHAPRDITVQLPAPLVREAGLHIDAQGRPWASTLAGPVCHQEGRWQRLTAVGNLPSTSSKAILVDREGSLWLAAKGVHRMLGRGDWHCFTPSEGLPHEEVWSILRDRRGTVWVGTQQGVARLRGHGWEALSATRAWHVRALAEGKEGLWVATATHGLQRLSLDGQPAAANPGLPVDRILHVQEDGLGRIWVGTASQGLFLQERGAKAFQPVVLPGAAPGERINQILPVGDDTVWVAGANGLARLRHGTWTRFGHAHGLRHLHVGCLTRLADGRIAIGYFEPVGISLLRETPASIELDHHLDTASGLASDLVYWLQEDRSGSLWIGTGHGVHRLSGDLLEITGKSEGLVGEDCNALACLLEPDDGLWVGTSEGLAYRHASPPSAPPNGPATDITDVRVHGRHVVEGGSLPPMARRDRDLFIAFTGMTALYEARLQHRYRLLGLNDTWQATTAREARFPALAPGSYTFEVQSRIGNGPWGPAAQRHFTLEMTWWQNPWLQGTGAAGLIAIAGLFLRRHVQRLRRRTTELQVLLNLADQLTQELETANKSLKDQSMTDPLTGLRNRRYVYSTIQRDVAQVDRAYRQPLEDGTTTVPRNADIVFLMVDVDHFKRVNDTHGHAAGDAVLEQMADLLRAATRGSDAVVRWGGEEFLIIARHTDRQEATTLAERVRRSVASHRFEIPGGTLLRCTCSVGFASYPLFQPAPATWEDTVNLADSCLYRAKAEGRNRWKGFVTANLTSESHPISGPLTD